ARLGSGRAFDGCAPAPRPTHRSPEATSTSGLREALLYGAREPATGPSTSATALVVSARSVRFAPPTRRPGSELSHPIGRTAHVNDDAPSCRKALACGR